MKKVLIMLLLLPAVTAIPVFADYYYETGDTAFSFNVGVSFPAFEAFTDNPDKGFEPWINGTHFRLGGYGSLGYQSFITRNLALGGEMAYVFNNSFAGKIFTTIPITAKLSWYPVQTGKFDLIFHFNAGVAVLRYETNRFLAPQAQVSVNPVYYLSDSWGLGLNAGLWLNYEFYTSSASGYKANENAFGAFMPITLSLIYRH